MLGGNKVHYGLCENGEWLEEIYPVVNINRRSSNRN